MKVTITLCDRCEQRGGVTEVRIVDKKKTQVDLCDDCVKGFRGWVANGPRQKRKISPEEMMAMRRDDATLSQIAEVAGVSPERVRQTLKAEARRQGIEF